MGRSPRPTTVGGTTGGTSIVLGVMTSLQSRLMTEPTLVLVSPSSHSDVTCTYMVGGADKGQGEDLHSKTSNNASTLTVTTCLQTETQSDIALVIGGPAYSTLAGKLIDLADARKTLLPSYLSSLTA